MLVWLTDYVKMTLDSLVNTGVPGPRLSSNEPETLKMQHGLKTLDSIKYAAAMFQDENTNAKMPSHFSQRHRPPSFRTAITFNPNTTLPGDSMKILFWAINYLSTIRFFSIILKNEFYASNKGWLVISSYC